MADRKLCNRKILMGNTSGVGHIKILYVGEKVSGISDDERLRFTRLLRIFPELVKLFYTAKSLLLTKR